MNQDGSGNLVNSGGGSTHPLANGFQSVTAQVQGSTNTGLTAGIPRAFPRLEQGNRPRSTTIRIVENQPIIPPPRPPPPPQD